jgi:hypothetical protein
MWSSSYNIAVFLQVDGREFKIPKTYTLNFYNVMLVAIKVHVILRNSIVLTWMGDKED